MKRRHRPKAKRMHWGPGNEPWSKATKAWKRWWKGHVLDKEEWS